MTPAETRNGLWPAILTGVMGNSVIYLIPLLIGAMIVDRGFTEQQAGLVASADLAGYAVATLVTALLLHRLNWRRAAIAALIVMVVANLVTTRVMGAAGFAAVRFVSGLGGGVLAAIATVLIGRSRDPHRGYGVMFAVSLLFGTTALWALPWLFEWSGLNGGYLLVAFLALLMIAVAARLPTHVAASQSTATASPRVHWKWGAAVLGAILLFWAQQNALYAFMERIGNAAGLSIGYIGFVLGAANLTGFAGAALVAAFGQRLGRAVPLAVLTLLQLACIGLLAFVQGPLSYLLIIGAIALAWNVVNPIQLGLLASVDPGGRLLAMSATFMGVGLAAGPAMAALLVGQGAYGRLLFACGALLLLCTALMWPALVRRTS